MAAKLLQSLAEDNPDLQKQIGCMTGIFQIFDRHHALSARRITHKRIPSGNSYFSNGSLERETDDEIYHQTSGAVKEINLNKSLNDKQRLSAESSRASYSSSYSSSLSSMDCNRTQPEASLDRIIFPETPSRDPVMNLAHVPPNSGRQSLDLRDVVKDSMYRECRGISIKPVQDETDTKHRDSLRPLLLSKSSNGSYKVDVDGKQNLSTDLKESLRVLSKLKEAPWYYAEARELPRSSHDVKEGPWLSISKEAPRFSYDGRDIRRLSFESRDTFKATPKLKELPRLSLDSRESYMRNSSTESKMCLLQKSFQNGGNSIGKASNISQSSGAQKRLPGVVAKLMGLETLPDSPMAGGETGLVEPSSAGDKDPFSSLRSINSNMSRPSKFTPRDPTSLRQKNTDLVMKPISSSRFPIEPAPWKQQDGNRGSKKAGFRNMKPPARTPDSFPSVYSEIEKRLKDLEFKKSGRDLRALKQILETMQAKGLLDKEEEGSNFGRHKTYEPCSSSDQNSRSVRQPKSQINSIVTGTVRASDPKRGFQSPIVIMKPTKRVDKSGSSASSVVTMDGISDLSTKKASVNMRTAKDQSPRNTRRDAADAIIHDKKTSTRNVRSTQSPLKSPQLSKENNPSSVKNSGSVSPRLLQKKVELERSSRPPMPSSDSSKPRRLSSKFAPEATSPGGKRRPKFLNMQHGDDQLSQISDESRSLSCHGDDTSLLSDGKVLMDSKLDAEVASGLQSARRNVTRNPTVKTKCLISDFMQKNSTPRLDEDRSVKPLAITTPEQPSPVSVLDTSMYRDEALSPVKQISHAPEDDSNHGIEDNGSHWTSEDKTWSNCLGLGLTSEFNRKKLQNVENLVQKLRRLNSNHDEVRTDYIASLCENTNPDQRYISEILLASGLLLRDLSSDLMTFQLHPSGHPINPELFFVLEQTHASTLFPQEECSSGLVSRTKSDPGKHHRKLVFDTVNEILAEKLDSLTPSSELWLNPSKLAKKIPTAQKLLKELCYEVEQIQAKKPVCELEDEDDGLKSVLWEDVMHRSDSRTEFHYEIPGLVLDVERLVFKDLIDEVVIGEAAGLPSKPSRRCQLFAN